MIEVIDAKEFVAAVEPLLVGRKITRVFNEKQARSWWRVRHDLEYVSIFVADEILDALRCTHWLSDGTLNIKEIRNKYAPRSTPLERPVRQQGIKPEVVLVKGPRSGYVPAQPFAEWLRGQAGYLGGRQLAIQLRIGYTDYKRYTTKSKTVSKAVVIEALRRSKSGTKFRDLYPQLKEK